jgi:hypothetical protein
VEKQTGKFGSRKTPRRLAGTFSGRKISQKGGTIRWALTETEVRKCKVAQSTANYRKFGGTGQGAAE